MISSGMIFKNRYEIIDELGRGGMAEVYRIEDHALKKQAALKILKPSLQDDEAYLKRFIREAQAAAALAHPNIVDVYDVDADQGYWFIVMELVEGMTLKQYIQKKVRLSAKECISISLQAADALNVAHKAGVVHRDIKPDNIIITRKGNVKISDFGIARVQSNDTMTVDAYGSVYYSSPEQVRGGFSDQRTDMYSLGVTMYEMCTGRLPFVGKTVVEIAMAHMEGNVEAPREIYPDIPRRLNQVIMKAMSRRMDDRYQSMEALIKDLHLCIKDPGGTEISQDDHEQDDPTGKTVIFSEKQIREIKSRVGKKSTGDLSRETKKNHGAQKSPAQTKQKTAKPAQKKAGAKKIKYEEEPEVDQGLQRALNIGLVIIIIIVILFVLEFFLSSRGMLKGVTKYLPTVGTFGDWCRQLAKKLNDMHIGEYLRSGIERIMDIFRRRS